MFPPFPEDKAKEVLLKIFNLLEKNELEIVQLSKISEERKNNPVMLGSLVCLDKDGNEINLIALSGISRELRFKNCNMADNFVIAPPVVSAEKITKALSKNDEEIHRLTDILKTQKDIKEADAQKIKGQRSKLCGESVRKVIDLYDFTCIDKKKHSLKDICLTRLKGKLPQTGTGDCSAVKLLNYAFSNDLRPVSLCEAQRPDIKYFSPCDTRCKVILPQMLGLEILYQDSSIVVVNKQSGLLSVPGRGEDKKDSVETRLKALYPACINQPAVHRLDMETSGLMILALTKEAHRKMNMEFEARKVKKEYTALLDGVLYEKGIADEGEMELFFRLDVDNRPHQIWDSVNGKSAVTRWKILDVERYKAPDGKARNATRVLFTPLTGRTHQLRLLSADAHGFNVPIIGDTLYGKCDKGERLMLHSSKIEFFHPVTGEYMTFESKPDF